MKDLRSDYDSIFEIQVWLNALHHDSRGRIPLVHPDGSFSDETTAGVLAFQRMQGLDETGEVDLATYESLRVAYYEATREPLPLYVFPSTDYRASSGERSEVVELSQWMLRALAEHHDDISGRNPSGLLDGETEADLLAFQRLHGLEEHGEIDVETWDALVLAYDKRVRRVR